MIIHVYIDLDYTYVWIYENGAKELKWRPKLAFFSRQKLSPKSTISKLKGESVLFSFLYPFIFLSLPSFFYFLPVYLAGERPKSLWNQGEIRVFGVEFFSNIFINPDIYLIRTCAPS